MGFTKTTINTQMQLRVRNTSVVVLTDLLLKKLCNLEPPRSLSMVKGFQVKILSGGHKGVTGVIKGSNLSY